VRLSAVAGCLVAALALASVAVGDTAAVPKTAAAQAGGSQTGALGEDQTSLTAPKPVASALLQQCATATAPQTERSATFAGEMNAVPGATRMEMRINLEELAAGEARFRTVNAPGLGLWQRSAAGLKSFVHIQQVTNLSAPALYRAAVRFRWLNAKGRAIKTEELRTSVCEQPGPSATAGGGSVTGGEGQSRSSAS